MESITNQVCGKGKKMMKVSSICGLVFSTLLCLGNIVCIRNITLSGAINDHKALLIWSLFGLLYSVFAILMFGVGVNYNKAIRNVNILTKLSLVLISLYFIDLVLAFFINMLGVTEVMMMVILTILTYLFFKGTVSLRSALNINESTFD